MKRFADYLIIATVLLFAVTPFAMLLGSVGVFVFSVAMVCAFLSMGLQEHICSQERKERENDAKRRNIVRSFRDGIITESELLTALGEIK